MLDEIFRLVVVAGRDRGDLLLRRLVLQLVVVDERHRVDADVVGDDELHARQPDAVGRNAPPAERRARVAEVQHDLGLGLRHVAHVDGLDVELGDALVDEALVALGAGDRDLLVVVQHMRGVAGADDRRQGRARG